MESNLKCNYPKCKVLIIGVGCITHCSHVFCEQHKITASNMNRGCPACGSVLEGPHSVVFRETNPSEEWKSTALVGYTPHMIFEAMSKGLQFWQFQLSSQLMHRKKATEYWQQRLAHRECTQEALQLKIDQYVKMQTQKVDYYKNEVRSLTQTITELEGVINEKTRQLINLQKRFESLRRQSTASMMAEVEPMDQDEVNFEQHRYTRINRNPAPPTPQFVFKPNTSPISSFCASQPTPRTASMGAPMQRSCSQLFK